MHVYTDPMLRDMAPAQEARPGVSVQTPGQARLMREVTPLRTFWSFAYFAARYRLTFRPGLDCLRFSRPASVT